MRGPGAAGGGGGRALPRPGALARSGWRWLARHPWQTGLSVLGLALGVAVVVGIDLASASARRAFLLSAEAVTGRATHQVAGGPGGLDEGVYVRLVREGGARPAAPVVEGPVGLPGAPGRAFQLLGVDPLAEPPFRSLLGDATGGDPAALRALMTEPGAVLLAAETARELGLAPGDRFPVQAGGRRREARLAGTIAAADARSRQALASLVVADIATAQELLDQVGRLTRVDLVLPEGAAAGEPLARLRRLLPAGAELVPAATRPAFLGEVTRAFEVNLAALSLLALVVGLFLVYNAATFAVVQRRAVIGLLRAMGVTRGEVLGLVLGEALLLGAVATGLGLGLGVALAGGLARLVSRTISDLYFAVTVRELALSWAIVAKGAGLGIGATLAAVLVPALEATRVPPGVALSRATLEARARRAARRAAVGGLPVLAAGGTVLWASGRSLVASYLGLFTGILGAALLAPAAAVVLARLARPVLGALLGLPGRMAAGTVRAWLSRTGVAIAALMVAVATTVSVALMVASFRETVVRWLSASLVADVYVSVPGPAGARAEATLDPAVMARLLATPGVQGAGTYRGVRVASPRGPVQLVALDVAPGDGAGAGEAPPAAWRQIQLVAGDPARAWPAFAAGAVLVSEPFAHRHGVGAGASLVLRTDRGERAFPVAGVFADYGSDQGVVMLSRLAYERFWEDRGVWSLALAAAPGTDVEALVAALRARAGTTQAIAIRSTRALREASLEIFDRTFRITAVLRWLAVVVAGVGVLGALMALGLERARELGVLRAQGMTRGEVLRLVLAETGLMGGIAGILAVPLGIALALVLVLVINRRAFGWSLALALPVRPLVEGVGLAVAAALAAGLYPALRMARTPPAAVLREE